MPENDIRAIKEIVTGYAGLTRKRPIREVTDALAPSRRFGEALPNYGDDAAVIPFGDEYLLFATDGMMTGLLINEPYAAGKASVMVTVNDIYAMGGTPIGLVNVMAAGDAGQRARIVEGIAKGCEKLQVPMLGGHLHPDADPAHPALSVAILGRAKNPLRCHMARPGDDLVMAVDLSGRPGCKSVTSWDANSGKTPEELLRRLSVMPEIADKGLAKAAKDISNAGVIGTLAIMMENSGVGGEIDISAIPLPDGVDLSRWILCFQSFGFVLAAPEENTPEVLSLFEGRGITAAKVGNVKEGDVVALTDGKRTETLFDFSRDAITGIRYPGEQSAS